MPQFSYCFIKEKEWRVDSTVVLNLQRGASFFEIKGQGAVVPRVVYMVGHGLGTKGHR